MAEVQSASEEVASLDRVLTRLAVTEDDKLEQVRAASQSNAALSDHCADDGDI